MPEIHIPIGCEQQSNSIVANQIVSRQYILITKDTKTKISVGDTSYPYRKAGSHIVARVYTETARNVRIPKETAMQRHWSHKEWSLSVLFP